MATIAKRFRAFMSPPENELESLEELRQKTRQTLNRPYNLPEFKEKTEMVEEVSNNPFAGIFKPFGNAVAEAEPLPVRRKTPQLNWGDVAVPLLLTLLIIGGVFALRLYQQGTLQGLVSPVPSTNFTAEDTTPLPAGEVVPPGTELEPGGPYTGTGSTQPPTNLNGSPKTCPSGFVCSGTAINGECSVDHPCSVTRPGDVASLPPQITRVISGEGPDGSPCTVLNPCILVRN